MAFCNRSKTLGKNPEWLKRASDLRFTGHAGNGATQLRFELPSLGAAASEMYRQSSLFQSGRPDGNLTGLDLLMNVVHDIDTGKTDSDAFDPQLLHQVSKFKRFFKGSPFTGFRISQSGGDALQQVLVTRSMTENSLRLYGRTPSPQRVQIVGQLDGIESSTQRFSLLLDSSERVAGVYSKKISGNHQKLWRKRVLVLGTSGFRASGNLLGVEADSIENGKNTAALFSSPPVANGTRLAPSRFLKSQGPRSVMAAIMDRWPGNETDAELEVALASITAHCNCR